MKNHIPKVLILIIAIVMSSCSTTSKVNTSPAVKRVGMVIKLKPEFMDEYKALHADSNPGVRDLLTKYGIRNFSIFLHELEPGEFYEFGYYEYVGKDFEGDMEKMANEKRTIEWLKVCDPMQIPLKGATSWTTMEQVYFNQ
nr:L-rhamnose mutarotase [Allomuricauda sp.]